MKRLLLLSLLLAAPAAAQTHDHGGGGSSASSGWTTLPTVSARLAGRGDAEIKASNGTAPAISVRAPDGSLAGLPLVGGKAVYSAQVGNYHLVQATDTCAEHEAIAVSAVYFANPGPAPTGMLATPIQGLAVLPDRLPREHAAYRAGETWGFRVLFDGRPLPGARVLFETANGTKSETVSDLDGRVPVTFPEDFPSAGKARAPFVVAAVHQTGAQQHVGAFNLVYGRGAYDGKSLWTGVAFAGTGMVLAVPLLRRRPKKGGRP